MTDISIGSNSGDYPTKCIGTSDGGYIITGFVNIANIDVSGPPKGNYDFWVVKTNEHGNIMWNRVLGSSANDYLMDVIEDRKNGGFVLLGFTESPRANGDISTVSKGGTSDIWVVKLSEDGKDIQWEKRIGGNREDYGISLSQTFNGNFLIAGHTNSTPATGDLGNDAARGNYDYRIIEIDNFGVIKWDKRIGGSNFDGTGLRGGTMSAFQTADGGYLVSGRSFSINSGDKSPSNNGGGSDIWVVKLDANRTIQWDVTLGGQQEERLASVIETNDGGYIIGGTSNSYDPVVGDQTQKDYWIVKLSNTGSIVWENKYGGASTDELTSVIKVSDGGYVLGGWSLSENNGDKSQAGFGSGDYWIVKVFADGTKEWDAVYGGSEGDYLSTVLETIDGGLLLAGSSASNISGNKASASKGLDDFWLVKLGGTIPLPVELLSFKASITVNNQILLEWSTASEINNDLFTIEKSLDAINFSNLYEIPGAGNSSQINTYSFIDKYPLEGVSYYRLKQTDFDGRFKYSKVVSVQLDKKIAYDFLIFPNPGNGSIMHISLHEYLKNKNILITIEDVLGTKILEKMLVNNQDAIISLSQENLYLKKGIYIISVTLPEEGTLKKKILIQ